MQSLLGGGVTLNLPLHITLGQDAMNQEVSITSNLSPLFYLWGSALKLQPEVLGRHQLEHTVLFSTTPRAWTIPADAPLTPEAILQPPGTRPATTASRARAWPIS